MKFTITLGGQTVILTAEQLEALAAIIDDAEAIENTYMGAGKGVDGTNYMDTLKPFTLRTMLPVAMLTDTAYDALKFVTEAQKSK
jgi:hypothetical protein